jgi:molybdopterin synthase sulfur carrier subunit
MDTEITLFGRLAETAGTHRILATDVKDTDTLLKDLHQRFPELARTPVIIAVNRKTVTGNTALSPGDTVALMPPFSGG